MTTDAVRAFARAVLADWPRCVDHPENHATDADGPHGQRTLCGATGRWDKALQRLREAAGEETWADPLRPLTIDELSALANDDLTALSTWPTERQQR